MSFIFSLFPLYLALALALRVSQNKIFFRFLPLLLAATPSFPTIIYLSIYLPNILFSSLSLSLSLTLYQLPLFCLHNFFFYISNLSSLNQLSPISCYKILFSPSPQKYNTNQSINQSHYHSANHPLINIHSAAATVFHCRH